MSRFRGQAVERSQLCVRITVLGDWEPNPGVRQAGQQRKSHVPEPHAAQSVTDTGTFMWHSQLGPSLGSSASCLLGTTGRQQIAQLLRAGHLHR